MIFDIHLVAEGLEGKSKSTEVAQNPTESGFIFVSNFQLRVFPIPTLHFVSRLGRVAPVRTPSHHAPTPPPVSRRPRTHPMFYHTLLTSASFIWTTI